jgi:hypothetical protein
MKIKFLFLLSLVSLFFSQTAKAVCPVCVVAVGAGLGFSRWLGVDDVISSLWIGGILVAVSIWTIIWLQKKKWNFQYMEAIVPLAYYILTIVPLYYYGIVGHPLNTFWGTDKIIFGTTVGTLLFLIANWTSDLLKKKNKGKPYFPYQKVVLPFSSLLLVSLVLWMII